MIYFYEFQCQLHGRYRKYSHLLGMKATHVELVVCMLVLPLSLALYYTGVCEMLKIITHLLQNILFNSILFNS